MDKNEKTCPWCGGHSPLGTPCSAECEENHAKFQARAVWHKRFYLITVGVCVLSLLRNTLPGVLRTGIVVIWAAWLCVSKIVMPHAQRIDGCEKKTEQRVRTVGIVALVLLCAILIFLYTLDAKRIYGILSWLANLRK
ncbi:MAG: hypothetical protein IKZ09_11365 [Clostridia bacterium]|nr:hypothetical protein [Clostridia bacterium]